MEYRDVKSEDSKGKDESEDDWFGVMREGRNCEGTCTELDERRHPDEGPMWVFSTKSLDINSFEDRWCAFWQRDSRS